MSMTFRLQQWGLGLLTLLFVPIAFANSVSITTVNSPTNVSGEGLVTIPFRVFNEGQEQVPLEFDVVLPASWTLVLEPGPATLEGGSGKTVFVSIAVPDLQPAGEYTLGIAALIDGDAVTDYQLPVIVQPREVVSLQNLGALPSFAVDESSELELLLSNDGNVASEVRVVGSARPTAQVQVTPEVVRLSPGEEATVRLVVRPLADIPVVQRISVTAVPADGGDPLSRIDYRYDYYTGRTQVTDPWVSVPFRFTVGLNAGVELFTDPLRAIRLALSGGGYLNEERTSSVRLYANTRGLDSPRFRGEYESPHFGVRLGDSLSYDLTSLSIGGAGPGFELRANDENNRLGVRAFAYLARDYHGFGGLGVQASYGSFEDPGQASVQFSAGDSLERSVLTARARVSPLDFSTDPAQIEQDIQEVDDLFDEGLREDAVSEELDEIEEVVDGDGEEDPNNGSEDGVSETLTQRVTEDRLLQRLDVTGEAGIGMSGGAAYSLGTELGIGPVLVAAGLKGWTEEYRGSGANYREISGEAALGLGTVIPATVSVAYQIGDTFDPADGEHVVRNQQWGVAAGLQFDSITASLLYANSRERILITDTQSRIDEFRLTWAAELGDGKLDQSLRYLRSGLEAGDQETGTANELEVDTDLTLPVDWGDVRASLDMDVNLDERTLDRLRAEVITSYKAPRDSNLSRIRGGVRYTYRPNSHTFSALAGGAYRLSPTISLNGGVTGTIQTQGLALDTRLGMDALLANNHSVSLSGAARFTSEPSSRFQVGVGYTVPFEVRVARRPGFGSVSGRVLDADGEAVAGMPFRLGNVGFVTNEDGRFTLTGVTVGEHVLAPAGELEGVLSRPALPLTVEVHEEQQTNVQLSFVEAASLNGQVVYVQPEPREGIIYGTGDSRSNESEVRNRTVELVGDERIYQAVTGPIGHFSFPQVLPGEYTVRVLAEDLNSNLFELTPDEQTVTLERGEAGEVMFELAPLPRRLDLQNGREE